MSMGIHMNKNQRCMVSIYACVENYVGSYVYGYSYTPENLKF